MKRSTDRILTTHTGSLPRPGDLLEMIDAKERGAAYDEQALQARVRTAVAEVVRQQAEAGIDIVSDGEFGKPSFATYVKNRISGFNGQNPERRVFADRAEFPEWHALTGPPSYVMTMRPFCTEPLGWKDRSAVETDIANFKAALDGAPVEEAFIPAASIGIIAEIMMNQYYDTEEAYCFALADVMKEEYEAIANAGFRAPDRRAGRRHGPPCAVLEPHARRLPARPGDARRRPQSRPQRHPGGADSLPHLLGQLRGAAHP